MSFDIDMATVRFGVRTGNSKNKFETPVLVLGIDAGDAHLLRYCYNRILEDFRKRLTEIIDLGQDAYWDWCDAQEEPANA